MPELKHNFTSGRMNKDLDERLVPNGEYRDAQNVEVLTSEGSDIGTVQTCLGNSSVSDLTPDDNSSCVGSIADDKTNKVYYFIAGQTPLNVASLRDTTAAIRWEPWVEQENIISSDLVVEYNSEFQPLNANTLPVIVDIYSVAVGQLSGSLPGGAASSTIDIASTNGLRLGMEINVFRYPFWQTAPENWIVDAPNNLLITPIITQITSSTQIIISTPIIIPTDGSARLVFKSPRVLNFDKNRLITGVNIIDDMLFWTDDFSEPKKVNITRGKQGSIPPMLVCTACNYNQNTNNPYTHVDPVTGWGTIVNGTTHTELVVENSIIDNYFTNGIVLNPGPLGTVYGIPEYIQEKHITVIKKSPLTPVKLDMYNSTVRFNPTNRQVHAVVSTDLHDWIGNDPDDSLATPALPKVGMTSTKWNSPVDGTTQMSPMAFFDSAADFRVGDVLLLTDNAAAAIDGNGNPLPFVDDDVKIKLRVISSDSTPENPTMVESPSIGNLQVSILHINDIYVGGLPPGPLTWYIRLDDKPQSLYELKFPKFSYRYRYEDGEYSSFAPFSETAFLPNKFEYEPKKGYNKGMTNGLKQLFIKDFIPTNIPLDVVEVDILYKESDSPNIYTIRSFNKTDPEWNNSGTGNYKGNFEVKDDLIHAVVPSNQLLRPWDNVPRKALGQEVTGNRLIYGNYIQNYDLKEEGIDDIIKPSFKVVVENNQVELVESPDHSVSSSLKSMRTYQLGIVYKDKYGRETPVLSHPSATVKVDASNSIFSNTIAIETTTPHPDWADSFKYFIKEVSNEYYNLAMDRWYHADSLQYDRYLYSIWMSFPSEDRNKVDEETTLILKKAEAEDASVIGAGFVETTPRYKILAIKNEAPDFIKTTTETLGELDMTDTVGNIGPGFYHTGGSNGIPFPGYKEIRIKQDDWEESKFHSLQNEKNTILSGNILNRNSSIILRFIDTSGAFFSSWYNVSNMTFVKASVAADRHYVVVIDGYFKDEMEVLFSSVANPDFSDLIAGVRIELAKKTMENRPEFDGRFFVKIESDKPLKDVLGLEGTITTTTDWGVDDTMDSFFLYGAAEKLDPYCKTAYAQTGSINPDYGETTLHDNSIYPTWNTHPLSSTTPSYHGTLESYRGISCPGGGCAPFTAVIWPDVAGAAPNIWTTDCDQFCMERPTRSKTDWDTLVSTNGNLYISGGIPTLATGFWFFDAEPALFAVGQGGGSSSTNPAWKTISGPNFGKGANIGKSTISISFAGNIPHSNAQGGASPNGGTWTSPEHEQLTTIGQKFRFTEDPEAIVYEIYDVRTEWSWNWDYWKQPGMVAVEQTHEGIRRIRLQLDLIEPGSANLPGGAIPKAIGQQADATFITGSAGGFDDITTYSPCDYSDISGNASNDNAKWDTSIGIQFVSPIINQQETEYALNPAIWETEPKEDVGLDIYYEASQTYPTNMCDGTEELYIQVGAKVSMHSSNLTGTYSLAGWQNSNFYENSFITGFPIPSASPTTIVDSVHSIDLNTVAFSHIGGQEAVFNQVGGNQYIILDAPLNPALQYALDNSITMLVQDYTNSGIIPGGTTIVDAWQTIDGKYVLLLSNFIPTPNASMVNIPLGSVLRFLMSAPVIQPHTVTIPTTVSTITGCAGDMSGGKLTTRVVLTNGQVLDAGDVLAFENPDGTVVTATVAFDSILGATANNQPSGLFLEALTHGERQTLKYYNCYSYGNGVESDRIRDLFNAVKLDKGVKASTTLAEQYKEEHRRSGLIFSGMYNSMNGINRLNQFIMAENITKDLNPTYGSIQKLYQRDTDLITLCEDKVLKVLSNKDALFNADDTKNITATSNVLGNSIPFVGDYGISKNPESFASEAFRSYFTDRERGAVLRLSRDGLTPISDVGMKDWFADNLKTVVKLIGSYDNRKSLYNITLKDSYLPHNSTVSFSEKSKGWVSFKSINPEIAFSLNNEYYTGRDGVIWQHHDNSVDRNSFYDDDGDITNKSRVTVLFNDLPSVIKSFKTINYEGSQAKVIENLTDNKYYNNESSLGWHVNSIITDQQVGRIPGDFGVGDEWEGEFINKEGKWFNYISGEETTWTNGTPNSNVIGTPPIVGSSGNLDTQGFATQGVGVPLTWCCRTIGMCPNTCP